MIELREGDSLALLKEMADESVDVVVTSPPYYKMRDYGAEGQLGQEESFSEYIENLAAVFAEVYRVLKKSGSLWVNIDDVYATKNADGVKRQSLMCLPDRLKIRLLDVGFLCRNEIIWHKPNAMPSSAKSRFNNDYEKMYFFTKSADYYFETQYEPFRSKVQPGAGRKSAGSGKYLSDGQEKSVRQGMAKSRGTKIIEVRKQLPPQDIFVDFMRARTNADQICECVGLKRSKVEHWFRRDRSGFSYPSVEDWNTIKFLVDDFSQEFSEIDYGITAVDYETDDIMKNADKGRIKRSVWSVNTKPFKGCHFAPYPEELVTPPIKACCPPGGVVLDPFLGSGTTGVVAKKLKANFIGMDVNGEYIELARQRIAGG